MTETPSSEKHLSPTSQFYETLATEMNTSGRQVLAINEGHISALKEKLSPEDFTTLSQALQMEERSLPYIDGTRSEKISFFNTDLLIQLAHKHQTLTTHILETIIKEIKTINSPVGKISLPLSYRQHLLTSAILLTQSLANDTMHAKQVADLSTILQKK